MLDNLSNYLSNNISKKYLKNKPIIILLIIFSFTLFLSQLSLASSGCFLNQESDSYCREISFQEAEDECEILEECEFESDFFFGVNCEEFEQCNSIYCQSSCDIEYYGNCPYGDIPEEETYTWCSSGCCQLSTNNGDVCEYVETKFDCMLLAETYETNKLGWDIVYSESACSSSCDGNFDLQSFSLERKEFNDEKSNAELIYNNLDSISKEGNSEDNYGNDPNENKGNDELSDTSSTSSNGSSTNILSNLVSSENKELIYRIGLLIALFGFLIICLFMLILKHHWKHYSNHIFNREYAHEHTSNLNSNNHIKTEREKTKFYLPEILKFAHPKHTYHKIKNIKNKHSIRKKEAYLEENFPGPKPKIVPKKHLDKLQSLVKRYEHKKQRNSPEISKSDSKINNKETQKEHSKNGHTHLDKVLHQEIKDESKKEKNNSHEQKSALDKLKELTKDK